MAEVMQQRTRANQASGELVGLKDSTLTIIDPNPNPTLTLTLTKP